VQSDEIEGRLPHHWKLLVAQLMLAQPMQQGSWRSTEDGKQRTEQEKIL
jgi:hypothetical protein